MNATMSNDLLKKVLGDKTNEVARLRELLNRAIDNCECEPKCSSHFASYCDCGRYARNEEIRKELARFAPAPEEAVSERTCNYCDQPYSKHTSHPYEPQCPEPAPEWRELGQDEVICEGDECQGWDRDGWTEVSKWYSISVGDLRKHHGHWMFRTRRPLPKQEEERPLLKVMEYCRKWADEHLSDLDRDPFYARLGLLVDFATDFYSDQIEQLKKNQK